MSARREERALPALHTEFHIDDYPITKVGGF